MNIGFLSLDSVHYGGCLKTFKRMKIQKLRSTINMMAEWSQNHYIKVVKETVSSGCTENN